MAAVGRARASVPRFRAARAGGNGAALAVGRSPSGVRGFQAAQVADIQRTRILAAMFEVACERGAANVTVAHVVERSGVSRRTFYELFADRDDCLLAALDEAIERARERVLPAYRAAGRWCERVRAALSAFLRFLDEEPSIGRLLLCESQAAGPLAAERRKRVLAHVTSALDEGRHETSGSRPPELTAEGLTGGALSVIQARLAEPSRVPLGELVNPLMSMIVLPYLGSGAARRELGRPAPARPVVEHDTGLLADPFKAAGMRLTYRTVCVLLAIAENPDASNRLVGDVAGIKDQGQISKLLARLERAGLVENSGLGPGQGAPNAWRLTAKGRRVADGIALHGGGGIQGKGGS